jgi:uncharacterized protein YciI
MPLFAVIGLDHSPNSMDKRDAVRTEHRAYVMDNAEDIEFVAVMLDDAGNQCGSMYIFEAESEDAVRAWLAKEPFVSTGVYERLEVRRVMTGVNRLPRQDWGARG